MLPKPWAWNYPAEAGAMAGFLWELEPRRRGSSYQRYHLVLRERDTLPSPSLLFPKLPPEPSGTKPSWEPVDMGPENISLKG